MELLILIEVKTDKELERKFKFQYGATNIPVPENIGTTSDTFKFQYGATNISSGSNDVLDDYKFKFQYGATNIRHQLNTDIFRHNI